MGSLVAPTFAALAMGSQTPDPGVDVPSAPPCGPPVDFVPAARGIVPLTVQYVIFCTTDFIGFSFAFDTLSSSTSLTT